MSFILTIFLLIIFIPLFRRLKYGQTIRTDGPKTHLSKAGTPTMGGLAIGIAVIVSFLTASFLVEIPHLPLFFIPFVLYLTIGFIDDFLIVTRKTSKGISAKTKIILQIIGAAIYYYVFLSYDLSTEIFFLKYKIDLKWGYGLLILLMFVATSNAVNLSDGIDGLASGLTIISLSAIAIIAYYFKEEAIFIFAIIIIASLMAFLCYNVNPAKVIMGDTGSLVLGATIANLMILLKLELLLLIVAFVFVLEALSVIVQVLYFKHTKGKRIFLMAPIHHHFELKGYSEWQINIIFWFMAIISAIITLLLIL